MLDSLARADSPQDRRLLILPVVWNEHGGRTTDHFAGRIPIHEFCATIPAQHDAFERHADDRIVRRSNHGDQPGLCLLRELAVGNILNDSDETRGRPLASFNIVMVLRDQMTAPSLRRHRFSRITSVVLPVDKAREGFPAAAKSAGCVICRNVSC